MRGAFRMVDENLHAAMRFFGEATGAGQVRVSEGVEMIYSGLDYGVFNIALLSRPVVSERDLASILGTAGRFYHERKSRWSFWACEDLLDPTARRHSREIFTETGMRPISHAPGMLVPALSAPVRPLPELECFAVDTPALRAAFTGLTVTCFDIPMAVARAVYEPESAWRGAYRGFVGMANGSPVSIVALVRAGGVLGVYSLGTAPQHRHKGYGEAMLRAAVSQEQAALPARENVTEEPLELESTEAGYRLYRRLGFRDVTNYTVYLTR